jgi:RNA polymerase sigma-70 factor (ECF subfamily)
VDVITTAGRALPRELRSRAPVEPATVAPQADDRERFRASYVQHRDAVWKFFIRRLGDVDLADDLTSEVFVVAWRRRQHAPTNELAWLYGVARKVLSDDRRAARRRASLDAKLASHLVPESSRPADASVAMDSVCAEALARLSGEERELLVLAAWEGLSAAELAVVLDCRPSTARVRLHRARRRFAQHLNRLGHEGTTR